MFCRALLNAVWIVSFWCPRRLLNLYIIVDGMRLGVETME